MAEDHETEIKAMFICQRAVTGSHLPVYLCCLIIYSSKITFQYII